MEEPTRVASLNVQRLSPRERDRVARIGAFVGGLASDVVALQEVSREAAHEVARHAGFPHCTFVGHSASRDRGVALLHHAPARVADGARIAARPLDDKGYTRARLTLAGREIEIVGLHLDWLSRRARARQIEVLGRALGPPSTPRIVLGDLNAMTPSAWARGEPADDTVLAVALALGVRPPTRSARTFPSRAPRWALDWALASPDLALGEVQVVPTELSDHALIAIEVS